MRPYVLTITALGLVLVAEAGRLRGGSSKEEADRIAGLIQQLGDAKFAKREAASKELKVIGEPALAALLKAVAAGADPEIRLRAEKVVALMARTDVKTVPAPKGAVVLFDGKNLDAWVGRDGKTNPTWVLLDGGVMEARGVDIRTRQTFADPYKLHVEFRIPANPANTIHGRGNSGVYLHGRFEVQILDSYGPQSPQAIHSKPVESCGAIYGQTAARVNVCKAPGFWQSYDIEFYPPRFKGGNRVQCARMTVYHNGVLIHDQVEVSVDDTGQGLADDPALPGPVMLQYHSSPVQFRNVWLVALPKS
jgi:hypothetical protein